MHPPELIVSLAVVSVAPSESEPDVGSLVAPVVGPELVAVVSVLTPAVVSGASASSETQACIATSANR